MPAFVKTGLRRSRTAARVSVLIAVAALIASSLPQAVWAASPRPAETPIPRPLPTQPGITHTLSPSPRSISTPLSTGGNGLFGRYYIGASWSGSSPLARIDPTVDFDWSSGHPVNSGDFSVAWTGQLQAPTAGTYTFALDSDDGSTLAIDGATVVNNGGAHSEQTVSNTAALTAGMHTIDVRYFECCGGPAVVHLYWTPPGGTGLVVVPQANLFAATGPATEQTFGIDSGTWTEHMHVQRAEPVDTGTGNYVNHVVDLSIVGRGFDLVLARTYNSLDSTVGALGRGWTFSAFMHVTIDSGGLAHVFTEDGAQITFSPNGVGGFDSPQGAAASLVAIAGGHELTRRDGVRFDFNTTGQLTAKIDRNSNTQSFAYTSGQLATITDTVGRTVTLTYDTGGRLSTLTDPISRTIGYTYDASGRLATVTDARNGVTHYTYDSSGKLATIVDQNNHTLVTNTYDATTGRVTQQLDALNHATTFGWNATTTTSTMTDARGGVWTDVYANGLLASSTDPLGHQTTYTYDADFNRASVTDARSNTTTMTFDGAGNMLTRTAPAPLSYVDTWTYNTASQVTSYTDARTHTTTYGYDPSTGNLLTITYPDATTNTFTYLTGGLRQSATDQRGKTTTYAYDAQGNLDQITSPLGEITTMTYDGVGRMATKVDPRGNVSGGNPAQYTTTFGYDNADHVTSVTDPLGHVTSTAYDPAGNRSSITDPNTHTTRYGYDAANHLTTVTDAATKVTTYTYDQVGNIATRKDANNHITTYGYDLAEHLTSTTDPASHVWSLTYDPAGNVATRTDANNKTTTYTYDALNRLASITYASPSTPAVTFSYDGVDNRASMTDGAGTETYTYDTLNRLTGVTRGTDSFSYVPDPAGNIISRTYPDGTVTTYTYDDDGRLASATFPSGTPAADTTAPSVPAGLTATAAGSSQINLAWTASSDNVGVQGYKIYRGGTYLSAVGPVGSTSFSDTGLTASTNYSYTVSAIDGAGNESARSTAASATTTSGAADTTPPSIPTSVTATVISANQVNLIWMASTDNVGVTGYSIYRGSTKIAATSGSTTSFTDFSVARGTPYSYKVSASDAAGNTSAQSAAALANVPTGPRLDYDTFSGTNGTLLSAHTSDSGRGWSQIFGNPTINSNHVSATAVSSEGIMTGAGAGDVDVRLIVNLGADGVSRGNGIRFRQSDTSNWMMLKLRRGSDGTNQIEIWQDVATTVTKVLGVTLASGDLAANTEYELRLVEQGNTLTGYLNGVQRIQTTSSYNQSATGVGLSFEDSISTGQYVDLFEVWALVAADTTAPSVPSGLGATAVSASQINLAWTASTDAVGVQGYKIYRGGTYLAAVGPVASTSFSDTGLTAATAYTYTVSAIDGAGNESAQSSSAGATTLPAVDTSAPSVPTGVNATAGAPNQVSVTWAASSDNVGVTSYAIYRGGSKLSVVSGSTIAFTDRSTAGSTAYSYTVSASDAAGNTSAQSSPATVTTPAANTSSVTYTYDPASELTAAAGPDGVTERATYDRAGRLLEITNTETGGTLSRFTYGLDAAGNRTELTTSVGTAYFSYDTLDRLTGVCYGGACVPPGASPLPCLACTSGTISRPAATIVPNPSDTFTNFTYDPVGNRLTMVTYLGTTTYTYDAADRLTSSSGPGATAYTYDANGNELTAGTTTYTYDLADRMASATVGSTTQTYTWSGDGVRLSAATGTGAATTDFLIDRNMALPTVAAERDGTGAILRREIYGISRIGLLSASTVPTYEHHDGLGSVADLTNATGASLAWSEYAPYGGVRMAGAVAGAPADPFGFTGQYLDSGTGLLHLRARQYDPSTGRFTGVDPVGSPAEEPCVGGYVYATNNPVLRSDPRGSCPIVALAVAGGAIGNVEPVGGQLAGAAGGAAVGLLVCLFEVAADVTVGKFIVDQKTGGVIPQNRPMPRITVPYNPGPAISSNQQLGEQGGPPVAPGGGSKLPPKWVIGVVIFAFTVGEVLGNSGAAIQALLGSRRVVTLRGAGDNGK